MSGSFLYPDPRPGQAGTKSELTVDESEGSSDQGSAATISPDSSVQLVTAQPLTVDIREILNMCFSCLNRSIQSRVKC